MRALRSLWWVLLLVRATGSYELSAYPVDSFRAIISWQFPETASLFKVSLYAEVADGDRRHYMDREFDGTGRANSSHAVVISGLQPWTRYIALVGDCLEGNCSVVGNTKFTTPPESFPQPVITRVEATSNSSVQLLWNFPQPDRRLYEGFRVRCCPNEGATCFLFRTQKNNLTVRGLAPGTIVAMEVRAQFINSNGRPLLGPPARATVTTWDDLPKITAKHAANMRSKAGTSLIQWTCANSTFEYLQYKTSEYEDWSTCNNSNICDVTVDHGRTALLTSGFLRLTHGEIQAVFDVWIRGCNSYGCGQGSSVSVPSFDEGPSSLHEVSVTPYDCTGTIRWSASNIGRSDGIEATWYCNDKPKLVYHTRVGRDEWFGTQADIKGWSMGVKNCKFNVSAYVDDKDGTTHYSLPTEASSESR